MSSTSPSRQSPPGTTSPDHASPQHHPLARRRLSAATVSLAALALAVSGCAGQGASASNQNTSSGSGSASAGADASGSTADTAAAEPGGTLRLAVGSDAGCVDPPQVGSNDSIYSVRQLVDSLTDQDPETGELVPWLATEWEANEDATEFTFTLASGATFSDGEAVDSEAVKTNFDAIADLGPRAALAQGYLAGYEGTEVVDEQTFTVSFAQPNAQFLQATSTHTLGLLSPASVALTPDERCASVVGSGPFVLEDYQPNSSLTLAQRADYDWGSSLWGHEGAAYLDAIEVTVVPESGVRLGALQSGELDLIGNIAAQDETVLAGSDIQLLARSNPGIAFGLYLNHDTELLADPAVRTAISRGINRQEIVDTVFTSFGQPATSVLAATTPLYADQSALLGYDPEGAEQALTEAGYAKGDDGIYAKDGQPVSFEILWFNNAATNAPALELLQQQLRAVGIDVSLQEGQVADWSSTVSSGAFEANWGNITRADADILRSSFISTGANNYRLPASELDALLEQQAQTSDTQQRGELVAQAQEYIVSEHLSVPVVELTSVLASGPDTHGVAFDASSRIQLFDAWVDR